MSAATINLVASLFTILGLIAILGFFVSLFIYKRGSNPLIMVIERRGILLVFLVTLAGFVGSLIYSLGVGYLPCDLCWYQRIFMYPLVFIFGIDLWLRKRTAVLYGLVLSVVGFFIALYHTILQSSIGGSLPCPATGVSCAQRFVFEFRFVTIPLMSLTIFSVVLVILFTIYFDSKNK